MRIERFEHYTHERLDEMGVPRDPDLDLMLTPGEDARSESWAALTYRGRADTN